MHEEPGRELGCVGRAPRRPRRDRTTTRRHPRSSLADRGRPPPRTTDVARGRRRAPTAGTSSRRSRACPRHASSASASVGELRAARRAARRTAARPRSPTPRDCGVVVHDEHAVGGAAHVELDAVGAELRGRARTRRRCSRARRRTPRGGASTSGRVRPSPGSTTRPDRAAERATCSTFVRRTSWSDPLHVAARPLPCDSRCRVRADEARDTACDRAHKTGTGCATHRRGN